MCSMKTSIAFKKRDEMNYSRFVRVSLFVQRRLPQHGNRNARLQSIHNSRVIVQIQ